MQGSMSSPKKGREISVRIVIVVGNSYNNQYHNYTNYVSIVLAVPCEQARGLIFTIALD